MSDSLGEEYGARVDRLEKAWRAVFDAQAIYKKVGTANVSNLSVDGEALYVDVGRTKPDSFEPGGIPEPATFRAMISEYWSLKNEAKVAYEKLSPQMKKLIPPRHVDL